MYLREFLLEVIAVKMSTAISKKDVFGVEFSKNGLCKFSSLFKILSISPRPEKNKKDRLYWMNIKALILHLPLLFKLRWQLIKVLTAIQIYIVNKSIQLQGDMSI